MESIIMANKQEKCKGEENVRSQPNHSLKTNTQNIYRNPRKKK